MNKSPYAQKGFSLVEVMVAVGLIGIVALAGASQMVMTHQFSQFTYTQQGRDQSYEGLAILASSPAALYWSATASSGAHPSPINSALAACVLGTGGPTGCTAGGPQPLSLMMPNIPVAASGPSQATAVLLDRKSGNPCNPQPPGGVATGQCPFQAWTSFAANCALTSFSGRPSSCQQAESISVTYNVINAYQVSPGVRAPSTAMQGVTNTVTIPTAAMSLYKPQQPLTTAGCPAGKAAVGVDNGGNVLCQQLSYQCAPGQITVGLDQFGRPIGKYSGSPAVPIGQFDPSVVQQVICINASCAAGSLEVGMLSNNTTSFTADCFSSNPQCPLSNGSNPPQVFYDILAGPPPAPQCQTTQTCYQPNPTGTEGNGNFTNSIPIYNGPIGSNVIVASCSAYGCQQGQYMESFDPVTGNCSPLPAGGGGGGGASCGGQLLSWIAGGNTCTGNVGTTANNASTNASETSPNTGSATFTCLSGTWSAPASASCTAPTPPCPAQTLSWTVGGVKCSQFVSGTTPPSSSVSLTSTNGNTGNADFACSATGSWASTASPSPAANCTASGSTCGWVGQTIVYIGPVPPPIQCSYSYDGTTSPGTLFYATPTSGECSVPAQNGATATCTGVQIPGYAVSTYNCLCP